MFCCQVIFEHLYDCSSYCNSESLILLYYALSSVHFYSHERIDPVKNIQNKAKLKTEHSFAISEHMCYHILYITDYVK